MKKLSLTLLLLAIVKLLFAQNTFPGSGNVGIGTTSPVNNLQIGTQTSVATAAPVTLSMGGTFSSTAGANAKLKLFDDGTSIFGFGISTSQIDAIVPATGNFAWYEGGSQKMILNGAGNVGIGTSNPAAKLDVNGAGNFSGNLITGIISVGTDVFQEVLANSYYNIPGVSYGGQFRWYASPNNSLYKDNALYQLRSWDNGTNTENTILTVTGSGNLSIGTTNAQGYMLAVNGSAIATSVTVKLNSNWPDYVFKKNFLLPTLAETAAYIDQNHHLPEIPSEQDVAKNGLNLGEMNRLLVKKVEELTLYLIEKDKTEKEQQKQIDLLIKQVTELSKSKSN